MGSEYPKGGGGDIPGAFAPLGGGDIPRIFVPRWRYSSTFLKIISCPPQNMSLPLKCPPNLAPPLHEVDLNGNLINDSNKIADAFNEHFSNIGPKLADNVDVNQNNRCYLDYLPSQNNNIPFQLKETNFSAVFVLLSKLSRSKATGLDKISSRLLRECPDLIAESLSYIFNRSIVSGIFP